jgi:hypothetical protein
MLRHADFTLTGECGLRIMASPVGEPSAPQPDPP